METKVTAGSTSTVIFFWYFFAIYSQYMV